MYKPIRSVTKINSFLSKQELKLLLQIFNTSHTSDWDEGRKETGYFNFPIKSVNPDKPSRETTHLVYKQNVALEENKEVTISKILLKSLNMLCFGTPSPTTPIGEGEFPCKYFDSFIIKFPEGSFIAPHIDPSPKNKIKKDENKEETEKDRENESEYVVEHRRMNIIIQKCEEGGELGVVENEYSRETNYLEFTEGDGYIFRPDIVKHSVKEIKKGTRLVWSVGAIVDQIPAGYEVVKTKQVYIIGPGEVGKRIGASFTKLGYNCSFVSRSDEEGWKKVVALEDDTSLRIMCMREDDLQPSLSKFPPSFPFAQTTILVQNGFLDVSIDPLFLSNTTRLLVYFTSKGDFFEKLQPSPVHGPLATLVSDVLTKGGLDTVEIRDPKKFVSEMALKGIWNGVLGLPLVAHKIDYATYRKNHDEEFKNLVAESTQVVNQHYDLQLVASDVAEVIDKTTKNLGWMKGGVRGLNFRNKAIVEFARKYGIQTPVNNALISAANQ